MRLVAPRKGRGDAWLNNILTNFESYPPKDSYRLQMKFLYWVDIFRKIIQFLLPSYQLATLCMVQELNLKRKRVGECVGWKSHP